MTTNQDRPVPQTGSKPYPYRTFWAVVLLVGNIIIASIYFHIFNP
jgi:photosystem I protein